MNAVYVMAALVIGVLAGAIAVSLVIRGQSRSVNAQILDHVQRIGAVFANAGQRGRAGEIALQNLLEASGMGAHRDFEVQEPLPGGGRPDLVLNLPGRGRLFIDAKFPLDDFQRAVSAPTDKERRQALIAHGNAVAAHVVDLAKRDYPSQLPDAMDFVVCYVPSEELLAAAYEAHPTLFYDAARDRVLIAGPATLLSILWGIAHGLQQDARAQHVSEIGQSAAELHRSLGDVVPPLQKLRSSINVTARSYNTVLAVLESRVLPQVRQLEDMGIFTPGTQLPTIKPISPQLRQVDADSYPASDANSPSQRPLAESGFNDTGTTTPLTQTDLPRPPDL